MNVRKEHTIAMPPPLVKTPMDRLPAIAAPMNHCVNVPMAMKQRVWEKSAMVCTIITSNYDKIMSFM